VNYASYNKQIMMKITFLGGAEEVGASCTLLEISGKRILVDAGIRPSPKSRWGLAGDLLPDLSQIDAQGGIDAILVTHAHTDHTGALELVVGRYPDAPVYATPPTIALTRVLHADSRRIMQSRLDEEGELPLFDDVAVQRLLSAFVPVQFQARLPLGESLAATFFPAGHIAGAAMIGLESNDGNLLFTGDLSISAQRTVDGARPPAFHPDVLIVESTYGGRLHANRAAQERKLAEKVAAVTGEGGKVLIPAFALGRAQEILLILNEFQRRGELPALPVWADGMVRAICQVYAAFPGFLPLTLQEQNAQFFNERIRPVQTQEQRNNLTWQAGPAVIVASSGMLAGGPSQSYARALATAPQNAILLTGYQDEESPGRRLQEMAERGSGTLHLGRDKSGGAVVDVRCHLGTYSLSAHADEGQLISLIETLAPEHVVLVHGDEEARHSLERALKERRRIVHLPEAGQSIQLHFEKKRTASSAEQATSAPSSWKELAPVGGGYYALDELPGRWLVLSSSEGKPYLALCRSVARRELQRELRVETVTGEAVAALPEQVIAVLDETRPDESALATYHPGGGVPVAMEPNQALAFANQHFPPEARLRKSGYRLDQHKLVLTFDFPDAASQQFTERIAALQAATGWEIEISPEANQQALYSLAREVLPEGCQIVKGPAIHREQKRVAVTISHLPHAGEREKMLYRFREISGYELDVTVKEAPARPQALVASAGGETDNAPWEINAAYSAIKTALEGSTLYRASLKGTDIVLSFISPQVGERYMKQIEALSRQVGWPLRINPQPNQGAILETARALMSQTGWTVMKGPSIYPEKTEVSLSLATAPRDEERSEVAAIFLDQTGYQLVINLLKTAVGTGGTRKPALDDVEIPINRIHLRPYHQNLTLDPNKVEKALERARRMGITPPISVRRVSDGYILVDGLYRLKAAISLGMDHIPAVVE
jgi:Cft2 family RNA processing exonuclease